MPSRWPRLAVPAVLALAALWSLAPLAIWWDGADAAYFAGAWEAWAWGALVVVLLTALAVIGTRGRVLDLAQGAWRAVMAMSSQRFVAVAAATFAVLAVLMCLLVFAGNPRNVDGFAQLFQARIFLAGRAWAPPPADIAAFATLHMIVGPARWFAQYPPGQSVVLAGGLALGAWWLLNPLLAAALTWATWRTAQWCAGEAVARAAAILLCLSPFAVAVAGSEMSHLGAATFALLAAAVATYAGGRRGTLAALAAGVSLGIMASFRPLDAVAAAAPVALILWLAFARSSPDSRYSPLRPRINAFLATGIGGITAVLPTLAFNQATTGSWRVFGYTYLWGPEHSLGFHPVPWGVPLTVSRAIARSGLDLHQLNTYLFDAPLPILPVIALGFLAGRRALRARDAVPAAGAAALVAVLFAYWHRDVFYGPRFLFSAVPWFVILAAGAIAALWRAGRGGSNTPAASARRGRWGPAAALGIAIALAVGLVTVTPGRIAAYRAATPLFDFHPDRDAENAGIANAVVVIPDGWGTRLITRMWAAGVPPRRSTRLYAAIDACALELQLQAAAARGQRGEDLVRALDSLAALGRPGYRRSATEDPNLRLPAGDTLPSPCNEQVLFDRRGFIAYAPYLYLNTPRLDGDVVWARDMGPAGNASLFARYPGRRYFRYAPPAPNARPVFTPLEAP